MSAAERIAPWWLHRRAKRLASRALADLTAGRERPGTLVLTAGRGQTAPFRVDGPWPLDGSERLTALACLEDQMASGSVLAFCEIGLMDAEFPAAGSETLERAVMLAVRVRSRSRDTRGSCAITLHAQNGQGLTLGAWQPLPREPDADQS